MARITAAVVALLALAACSTAQQSQSIYRSGAGIVEAVQAVAVPAPEPVRSVEAGGMNRGPLSTYSQPAYSNSAFRGESASAGASGPGYQLSVRMDDGSRQSLVSQNRDFRPGDRVHVTGEGAVTRQ